MAGGWWCCCPTCWSFADSFCCPPIDHCGDFPHLGPHWEPLPKGSPLGSWRVNGDLCLLIEPGTPGSIIRNTDCVPSGPLTDSPQLCDDTTDCDCYRPRNGYCSSRMRGQVTVLGLVPDASYSLLLCMKDENNYVEARVVWEADEDTYLQIWSKVNGVESKLAECGPRRVVYDSGQAPYSVTIYMCVDQRGVHAWCSGSIEHNNLPHVDPVSIDCGFHGGMKHTASVPTAFTDYFITQLDTDHADCPNCGVCVCQAEPEITYPRELTATFIDQNGNWPGYDGYTITLRHPECDPASTIWGGIAEGGCLAPRNSKLFSVRLMCLTLENLAINDGLELNAADAAAITELCCGVTPGALPTFAAGESTCSPLCLVFYYSGVPRCSVDADHGPQCATDGTLPPPCCRCSTDPPAPNQLCRCVGINTSCPISLKIIITA